MDLSEEWKSLFPIGMNPAAPLLVSRRNRTSDSVLGPLFFQPELHSKPQLLFSSTALSSEIFSPLPRLSLPRYLSTSSHVLPSTASSVATFFGIDERIGDEAPVVHNRLQILPCRGTELLIFFPTGSNLDQVGFLVLSVEKSCVLAKGSEKRDVLVAKETLHSRIVRILVNPVDILGDSYKPLVTVGYVMAYTMYSVHWYSVISREASERPNLKYLGFKHFSSSAVAGACWSPHLPEECLVLLENGALFLFMFGGKPNGCFRGNRLKLSWESQSVSGNSCWLGCEFSWHPRIFIVARSDSVFLVDYRSGNCSVTPLAEIKTMSMYASLGEKFLVFSKAGTDGFHFALASQSLLLLCDIRRPLKPVLQWTHGVDNPCLIDFYRLSELRSTSGTGMYDWATDSGSCIILGSFWYSQFSLFCYGPPPPLDGQSIFPDILSRLRGWELPSELLLSGKECRCGDCILREQVFKESLLDWIEWQQKKEIVIGFCVLNRFVSIAPSDSTEFCGFTLIRLMSSGKLEAERYHASWDLVREYKSAHKNSLENFDSNLYVSSDEQYNFPRRFKYLTLNFLQAYLNGNLANYMNSRMKVPPQDVDEEKSFSLELHELICQKLKTCGFGKDRASPALLLVFNDISLPTSVFEIALRQAWVELPMELLLLAFSNCVEIPDVLLGNQNISLELLMVPEQPQLPPFLLRNPSCRSSKGISMVQPIDVLAGPVIPLPILLTLHEFYNGCPNPEEDPIGYSPDDELSYWTNRILHMAKDIASKECNPGVCEDKTVSLADDDDNWADTQSSKSFISYCPISKIAAGGHAEDDTSFKSEDLGTLIAKVSEKNNVEPGEMKGFNNLCPIDLKFDKRTINFDSSSLGLNDALEKQFLLWQKGFKSYQTFLFHHNM